MKVLGGRLLATVCGLLLLAACTSSDDGDAAVSTPSTTEATTTSVAPSTTEPTSTTLSAVELRLEAEREIEAVIQAWFTHRRDTSKGDAGIPLEYVTGPLRDRIVQLSLDRTAAGEIQRSRGGERIEVVDIRVDMEEGVADVDVCAMGDDELVDAETGELLNADDGDAWEGQAYVRRVDGTWLVEDFFSDEASGGSQCVFSE